ncbi:MAG: hypothetical protein ACXVCR_07440 [Bdellovibrio sp.]
MDEKIKNEILKKNPKIDLKVVDEFQKVSKSTELSRSKYDLEHPFSVRKKDLSIQEHSFNSYKQIK